MVGFIRVWHPVGREVMWRGVLRQRLTESDFRRLEVAGSSLGIYYYEVVSPGSGGAEVLRLTESDFRRLEVVCGSLGIYYYEVVSPGSGRAGIPQVSSPGSASFSLIFIDFS